MSIEDKRARATRKIDHEIKKETNLIINIAKMCGLGELYYCIAQLHFTRIFPAIQDDDKNLEDIDRVNLNHATDSYKYLIQILKKHCQNRIIFRGGNNQYRDLDLINELFFVHRSITTKHQARTFVEFSKDFELYGERDQDIKINLETILNDPINGKFWLYGARVERDNQNKLIDLIPGLDLINDFYDEYKPFEDLFQASFMISLDKYIEFVKWIVATLTDSIKLNEEKFSTFENGEIDINAYVTAKEYVDSITIDKDTIVKEFGIDLFNKIDFMIFKEKKFDENQYKFDLVNRQPILAFERSKFIFSPELILDSLSTNIHYSLLENTSIKNQYVKRYSDFFLDKIGAIASNYGFVEKSREVDLYDGKKLIGDIDLILVNKNNFHLLVEAKSHSLPLDVYFHRLEAVAGHLKDLQKKWEDKVARRINFLRNNHDKYDIPETFLYIIVSKQPEVLSHFSSILVLSIDEFNVWLAKSDFSITFQNIYDDLYSPEKYNHNTDSSESGVIKSTFSPGLEFRNE